METTQTRKGWKEGVEGMGGNGRVREGGQGKPEGAHVKVKGAKGRIKGKTLKTVQT